MLLYIHRRKKNANQALRCDARRRTQSHHASASAKFAFAERERAARAWHKNTRSDRECISRNNRFTGYVFALCDVCVCGCVCLPAQHIEHCVRV